MGSSSSIAASSTYAKRTIPWLVVAIVVLAVIVGFVLYRNHARAERIGAAQSVVSRYRSARDRLAAIDKRAEPIFKAQSAHYSDASTVSQKRHDSAVSGSPDLDAMYGWAKQEVADVDQLQSESTRIDGFFSQGTDVYEGVYGAAAVSKVRDLITRLSLDSDQWLSSWSRAAGDVTDNLKMSANGEDAPENPDIERYYNDSDQKADQVRSDAQQVEAALSVLGTRLKSDLKKAQAALKQAQSS